MSVFYSQTFCSKKRKRGAWNVKREAEVFTSDVRACGNYSDDVYFSLSRAKGKKGTPRENFDYIIM